MVNKPNYAMIAIDSFCFPIVHKLGITLHDRKKVGVVAGRLGMDLLLLVNLHTAALSHDNVDIMSHDSVDIMTLPSNLIN